MELNQDDVKELEAAVAGGYPRFCGIVLALHSTYPSILLEMQEDVMIAVAPTAHMYMDRRELENVQFPICVSMKMNPGIKPYEIPYLQKIVARLVICQVLNLVHLNVKDDQQFKIFIDSQTLEKVADHTENVNGEGKDEYRMYGFISFPTGADQRTAVSMHVKFQAGQHLKAEQSLEEDKPSNTAMAIMAGKLH